MRLVDLHVHTTASDGLYSPAQLVGEALKRGLAAVAITDHDTMKGLQELDSTTANCSLEIVPGIEFSTFYQKKEIHLLGYYCDPENLQLQETLSKNHRDRHLRMEKMVNKLKEMDVFVELDEVLATVKGGVIGRPHLAAVLCQKGYCSTVEEAFNSYIGYNRPAYVERAPFSPGEAIAVIKEAGGFPVLAHPGLGNDDTYIPSLVHAGIKGLEVYHPEHDAASITKYLRLAREYDLVVTGGSDFHGEHSGPSLHIGTVTVDYSSLEAIKKSLRLQGKGANDLNIVKKGF